MLNREGIGTVYMGYFVPSEYEVVLISVPCLVIINTKIKVAGMHRLGRKAKFTVLYTTFETTAIPASWSKLVNIYDRLVVSCEEIVGSFKRGGTNIPIDIVPLGVDSEDWPILSRTEQPPLYPFRFLMYADGAWDNHRKGYALAYNAFLEEFADDENIELYLKLTEVSDTLLDIEKTAPKNVYFFKQVFFD